MNAEEFLQDHAKWKYGKDKEAKPESPGTWLMTESGYYFPLGSNLISELKGIRASGLFWGIYENQTSMTMSHIQAELKGIKDEPVCVQKL